MLQEYRVGVDCAVKEGLATLLPPSLSPGYLPNLCLGQISKSGREKSYLCWGPPAKRARLPCRQTAVLLILGPRNHQGKNTFILLVTGLPRLASRAKVRVGLK